MQIQKGQRLPLSQVFSTLRLTIHTDLPGMVGADVSMFGLNEDSRLSDDRYFVFYNQTSSPEGAIRLDLRTHEFLLDLERIPLDVHRLMLTATSDEQAFAALGGGTVRVTDGQGGELLFEVSGDMFKQEQAVMLTEIYRHQGNWRVAGVAQGFSGGLAALLQSFGGEIADDEAPASEVIEPGPNWDTSLSNLSTIFGQPAPTRPEQWFPLMSAAQPIHEPGSCIRCGRRPSVLGGKLNSYGLCKSCTQALTASLQNFRVRFQAACTDGLIELREWEDLQQTIYLECLDAKTALEFVRPEALDLLERTVTLAKADGGVSEQEEEVFERLVGLLQMPDSMVRHLRAQIAELRVAAQLREGHLPTIESTLILDAGEIAHLEIPAIYRHVTNTRTRDIEGRIVLTNRQMHFVGNGEGGWTVQYGKVLRIEQRPDGVNLELGVKKGSGYYRGVAQPLILTAMLDALVRMHKRLLLMPQGERASRSIPQKVKLEVWQRDQGKCVECADTNYLEFDHIIPHSLGGATSVGNLQLLCRRCNLAKSNRI